MRVISRRVLREFAAEHPKASPALSHWASVVQASQWDNPAALRSTFGSVDFVGELTVFNLGGNHFRLIAFVHYGRQIVFIKHVLTHREYDKGTWKQ